MVTKRGTRQDVTTKLWNYDKCTAHARNTRQDIGSSQGGSASHQRKIKFVLETMQTGKKSRVERLGEEGVRKVRGRTRLLKPANECRGVPCRPFTDQGPVSTAVSHPVNFSVLHISRDLTPPPHYLLLRGLGRGINNTWLCLPRKVLHLDA